MKLFSAPGLWMAVTVIAYLPLACPSAYNQRMRMAGLVKRFP
jgi:hypothetical protein